jgi:hypothetical protein
MEAAQVEANTTPEGVLRYMDGLRACKLRCLACDQDRPCKHHAHGSIEDRFGSYKRVMFVFVQGTYLGICAASMLSLRLLQECLRAPL